MSSITYGRCCPKCGRSYRSLYPESEIRCEICGTITKDTHITYYSDDEYINANKEEIRSKFCIGSSEFDQRAWDRRVDIENGIIPWHRNTTQVPKCPTCGSTNIRKISGAERGVSVVVLGLFSKKINKSFECGNCKYTW